MLTRIREFSRRIENLITGNTGCCARAAKGHTAAALPKSVINSRRLMRLVQC
jgi:hypothetical protein